MQAPEQFYFQSPALTDYWRGIVLFGRNVASYKFALAKSLLELKPEAGTLIKLEDLAAPFSRHICEHLKLEDNQGTSGSSRFLAACRKFNSGEISREGLVEDTARLGFANVIDAFHVVNQGPIPKRFFVDERKTSGGIRITEEFSALARDGELPDLSAEAEARWRLVETAWGLGLSRGTLSVEVDPVLQELFVGNSALRRATITSCRSALNGYQKGQCFYCFREIAIDSGTDVDHFFPHVLKGLDIGNPIDGVWNLVLACADCNRGPKGKFARIPSTRLLERLWTRNEYLIASHHPLRETLMLQTGAGQTERRDFLRGTYQRALNALLHTWEPESVDSDPYRPGK